MNNMFLTQAGYDGFHLTGEHVDRLVRKMKDVKEIFADKQAGAQLAPDTIVYEVESYLPVPQDTTGGLFFGVTFIHPGRVGNEYFMTKGHFHKILNRAEFYWCIAGEGMLILMDENRNTRAEKMYPGSLHYINGHTAHRTANTGNTVLSFGACWPSDAGHDYDSIAAHGFSKILVSQAGTPVLIDPAQAITQDKVKSA